MKGRVPTEYALDDERSAELGVHTHTHARAAPLLVARRASSSWFFEADSSSQGRGERRPLPPSCEDEAMQKPLGLIPLLHHFQLR